MKRGAFVKNERSDGLKTRGIHAYSKARSKRGF